MNSWHPKFIDVDNIVTGRKYYHSMDGDENFISEDGLLLDNADQSILRNIVCTKEFLDQLRRGNIRLFDQTRLLKTLHDVYMLCRYNPGFQELMPIFIEAMIYFRDNIDDHYKKWEIETEIDNESLNDYYGFGGYSAVIGSCLGTARVVAVKDMIKTFATQYTNPNGYKGDLYGECWIELNEPKDKDIIKYLAGEYEFNGFSNAIIRSNENAGHSWRLSFIGLSIYQNRLMLDKAALEAAATVVSEGLYLNASVKWYLKD